jgi:hypothetical protein
VVGRGDERALELRAGLVGFVELEQAQPLGEADLAALGIEERRILELPERLDVAALGIERQALTVVAVGLRGIGLGRPPQGAEPVRHRPRERRQRTMERTD